MTPKLGRKVPSDWKHVDKYPLRKLGVPTVAEVNKTLCVPSKYQTVYDQGPYQACVGYSLSIATSIFNRHGSRFQYYDALWLYNKSKEIDGDPNTTPEADEGAYLFAGFDVLRQFGHCLIGSETPNPGSGIKSNYWCTTVDEIRTAISIGRPVTLGTNWYENFFFPEKYNKQWWVGRGENVGALLGGHAWDLIGAYDKLGAFRMVQSWGYDFPQCLISYERIAWLLGQNGEAGVAIDLP